VSAALAGRRGTLIALLGVGLLALVVRLAFTFRAPPFVTNDSLSYLLPGFDLVHGGGFAPILKRPPLYPLFVGGVLGALGDDLRALTLVQHLLGVGTVLLTYAIGRSVFGPGTGLLAALLVAVSGPVVVTEHYLMSEGLFTALLLAGLLAYLSGIRAGTIVAGSPTSRERGHPARNRGRPEPVLSLRRNGRAPRRLLGWLALAGVLLGLAALTRPIAQLVLALLVVGLPFLLPRWRIALSGAVTLAALFGLTVLPWMLRNQAVQHTFAIAGGSGEGLAVRTIRYDQKFDFREPPGGDPDRTFSRARRILRDEAGDGSAFELAGRLRDELGVSEVEADRLMRTIAFQAILKQPGYYLSGTADMFVQTFAGRPVRLRQDWLPWRNIAWEERVKPLLPQPTAVEDRAFGAAERLATLYDPARVAPLLAILCVVGVAVGAATGRRSVLLVGLLVFGLLLAGAALIGVEWRYRFPLDPLISVLAAGGLLAIPSLATGAWRRSPWRRTAVAMDSAPPSVANPVRTPS
jgi:4-amino-4-deoxy-L-arabinose transferase-like glycosyltransferase